MMAFLDSLSVLFLANADYVLSLTGEAGKWCK